MRVLEVINLTVVFFVIWISVLLPPTTYLHIILACVWVGLFYTYHRLYLKEDKKRWKAQFWKGYELTGTGRYTKGGIGMIQ